MRDIQHKYHLRYFKIVSNFTCLMAHEITFNNFGMSLVVFIPINITTNHAITYTNVIAHLLPYNIVTKKKESKKQNIQSQTGKVYDIIILSHTAWIVFKNVCFGCTVISYYFFLNFNSRPVFCCQQMNMGTKINMISAPWLPNINYLCI